MLPEQDVVRMDLLDMHGALVQQLTGSRPSAKGENTLSVQLDDVLSDGPYVLLLRGQHIRATAKLVVER